MRKKVGIFTGYFLPHVGGVERYVDKMSEGLVRKGYDVVIVTSNHGGLKNFERINKSIVVYRLPTLSLFRDRYPLFAIGKEYKGLMKEVRAESIDYFVLNTRFHLTTLIGARLASKLGKKSLVIEHGTSHFSVGNPVLDWFGGKYEHFLTLMLKHYTKNYFGVSKKCNAWLEHFKIDAKGVFYNAVDPQDEAIADDRYFKKYSKGTIVITYAGRFIREKGVLNLINAYRDAQKNGLDKNCKLVLAGGGPLDNEIKDMIKGDKTIELVGRLDFQQVMSLYKRTDIFIYPSLFPEGLPTSILEAALMECAVIATPKGGTEEVIIDDEHGIIIDGTEESISTALRDMVGDPKKRRKNAQMIKARAKSTFIWELVIDTIDKEMRANNG